MPSDSSPAGESNLRKRKGNLTKSMDTLFPQRGSQMCRVCQEPVVDGRWNYCSVRCREIAQAVQSMFIWDSVRESVKERDDHTCQECGWSKEEHQQRKQQILDDTEPASEERRTRWDDVLADRRTLEVDHIDRIADGGHPFDESNLQTLCANCHGEKTARENSNREEAPEITLEDYMEQ